MGQYIIILIKRWTRDEFFFYHFRCHELKDSSCKGKYGHNYKKPFPDCCNQFCQSIVQLDDDREQIQLINPDESSSMQYSESYK